VNEEPWSTRDNLNIYTFYIAEDESDEEFYVREKRTANNARLTPVIEDY